jgi:hypothetical protein
VSGEWNDPRGKNLEKQQKYNMMRNQKKSKKLKSQGKIECYDIDANLKEGLKTRRDILLEHVLLRKGE